MRDYPDSRFGILFIAICLFAFSLGASEVSFGQTDSAPQNVPQRVLAPTQQSDRSPVPNSVEPNPTLGAPPTGLAAGPAGANAPTGQAEAPAPAAPDSPSKCNPDDPTAGISLTPDVFSGHWTDQHLHDEADIAPASPGDTTHFTLKGRHDWEGAYENGKLTFRRKPIAAEMEHNAPESARKSVEGQVEWRMELEPKMICGNPVLRGKWFPGRIKMEGAENNQGKVTATAATLAGEGTPIPVKYERVSPAIYGVVMLTDQTKMVFDGYPAHPYPYPEPPLTTLPNGVKVPPMEAKPFLDARAGNGRRYAANEHRFLYVYGQGLPKYEAGKKITVVGGVGAAGVDYSIEAYAGEKASLLSDDDKKRLADGKKAALKDIKDGATRALVESGDGMLLQVDMHSGILPGWKDFQINDAKGNVIKGNSRWLLSFGDNQGLVTFARDTWASESELISNAFLPERVFIMVKTETALPLDEIKVRVAVNKAKIKWNGQNTLVAKRDPNDPTKTTYRTAAIELVDPRNPRGPADPGVMFLTVNPGDLLVAWTEDPGLLRSENRKMKVQRSPAALGMTWKEALLRAAHKSHLEATPDGYKVVNDPVDTTDWSTLSNEKAAEISNYMVMDLFAENASIAGLAYKKIRSWYMKVFGGSEIHQDVKQSVKVSVADLAALLMFRDEFVKRMDADLHDTDKFPSLTDDTALRGFRKKLQPFAWDRKSAWDHLYVTCPNGSSCMFANALDDDFIEKNFKDKPEAADQWILAAMKEAVTNFTKEITSAKQKAEAIADSDAKGLLDLLGADCSPDIGDYPCGYMALRQFVLPRMMRLKDYKNPQRYFWIPDINARYTMRNLNTLIAAVKSQKAASSADTDVAIALASVAMGPVLSSAGAYGEIAAAVLEAPGMNSAIAMATEIPDLWHSYQELQFAHGASLVLGTERMVQADVNMTKAVMGMANAIGMSMAQDALAVPRVAAEIRTARIMDQVEAGGVKSLPHEDQAAFWRIAFETERLKSVSQLDQLLEFDRRVSKAAAKELASAADSGGSHEAGEGGAPPDNAPVAGAGENGGIPPTDTPGAKGAGGELPPTNTPLPKSEGLPSTPIESEFVAADGDASVKFEEVKPNSETVDVPGDQDMPPADEREKLDNGAASAKDETVGFDENDLNRANKAPAPNISKEKMDAIMAQVPEEGLPYRTIIHGEEVVFKLGERVGKPSATATVWRIESVSGKVNLPHCTTPGSCVIKIYGEHADVLRITGCSKQMETIGMLQPETMMTMPNAPQPFIIQERLITGNDLVMFSNEAEFLAHPDHEAMADALIDKFADIKDAGLGWSDGKLNNVYWKRVDGKWRPGTFDPDFLGSWADRVNTKGQPYAVGVQFSFIEADASHLAKCRKSLGNRIDNIRNAINNEWAQQKFGQDFKDLPQSMQDKFNNSEGMHWGFFEKNSGPYTASPEHFMETIFEDRGWVHCCDANGEFIDGALKVEQIRKRFPKFGLRDRMSPTDPSVSFYAAPTETIK